MVRQTKAEARTAFFQKTLEVKLDSDGQLQIKCRPVFQAELKKILREVAEVARDIVIKNHSKPDADGNYKHTGNLARSIRPGEIKKIGAHRITGTVEAGGRKAPYARYVHQGRLPGIRRTKPGHYFAFNQLDRGTFKIAKARLLTKDEFALLTPLQQQRGRARRNARIAFERANKGRKLKVRFRDADTTYEDVTDEFTREHSYASRGGEGAGGKVVIQERNDPGYEGDRFLNAAGAVVVGGRYKGAVNLPRRAQRV